MPHKKGVESFITEIPVDIKLGFYRVRITSEHKHATKLFAFCKTHTYTSIYLKHATYEKVQEDRLRISIGDDADYKITDYICNEDKEHYKLQSMIQPSRYSFRFKVF